MTLFIHIVESIVTTRTVRFVLKEMTRSIGEIGFFFSVGWQSAQEFVTPK